MRNTLVSTYTLSHPINNFGHCVKDGKLSEEDFSLSFTNAYSLRFSAIHPRTTIKCKLFIRELPIESKGIADLVVLGWASREYIDTANLENIINSKPVIRAFEFKLNDWRSGLMQAHRYKYFSDASILVIPKEKLKHVIKHLDVFRKLEVGLWGFCVNSKTIKKLYTPRPKQQSIEKYKNLVIQKASACLPL